jgi:6-pyruvoyltetrahydropterin/6-carboxytetrahydropterin synthase
MGGVRMYTLIKHFWISCAHHVPGSGRCGRIHGHNYKVTFCVKGAQLDELDMLIDFREVKQVVEERFDHDMLNNFPEFNPDQGGRLPTTERVAEVFFRMIDGLCKKKQNQPTLKWVEVHETNEAYARYEPSERMMGEGWI